MRKASEKRLYSEDLREASERAEAYGNKDNCLQQELVDIQRVYFWNNHGVSPLVVGGVLF